MTQDTDLPLSTTPAPSRTPAVPAPTPDPQPGPETPVGARPLTVVHVITSLPTGGAERQLELLLGRTAQRAATICLYEAGPVADSMRAAGHRVEVLGMAGWRKPLAIPRLARQLRRYRPDVVHVHLLAAQLWGIPAARLAGVPVVVSTEHSLMEDTIEGRPHAPWLRVVYRLLERLATHTIAVSDTTADRLRRWGVRPERVDVVENGIDFAALRYSPEQRARLRAELGIDDDTVLLGAVGRLDPVKRMDEVLRAAAPLLRRPGRVLAVAGAGPLLPVLQDLAAELGIAGSVRWLGARGDVTGLLSAMDLLVSASRDETFGMAVVEAVASGLPVVFVQCPALEELSTLPEGAVQVAVGAGSEAALSTQRLTAAMAQLLADGRRRHPLPSELTDRYGIAAAAQRVDEVYRSLARPRRRG